MAKIIYFHGNRKKKEIALTFDDGPCKETIEILDILKKQKIKSTFFVLGKKIKGNEKIIKIMIKEGHEVGNHTFHHNFMIFKNKYIIKNEIVSTDKELAKLKVKTQLLRPPYFLAGVTFWKIANELKKKIIIADTICYEWFYPPREKVIKRALKAKNGSIILFHEYFEDVGRNKDVKVLQIIIPALKKRGYKFVKVSDLIKSE